MIPLRDSVRSRSFPIINILIILTNCYVFWQELFLSNPGLNMFVRQYGVIPAKIHSILALQGLSWGLLPLITAMFLHGGWLHLLGNMLYLWVFGDNVEDRMGHLKYLLFYLAAGVAGNLAQVWADPASDVPAIGASGAVAGVLGAYFIWYPRARILTLVPIFIFISMVEIPALVYLFFWFGLQVLNGLVSLTSPGTVVAWWAHIGGFLAGIIGALLNWGKSTPHYPRNK